MKLKTKQCPRCGRIDEFEVDEAQVKAWKSGTLIQKAFPDLTPDQREQLITGYDSACWDELFREPDEEAAGWTELGGEDD
jgi:hypothetical protein